MGKILQIKNLTKKYFDGIKESKVVNNVSMAVDEREYVIIMGASGSGKTSLLHLIASIDDFDEGTICCREADFGSMNEREKTIFRRTNIGLVFQQHCLVPDLTVYENIMLPLMLERRKNSADNSMKDTILKLCGQFGLEGHVKKYPSQLSGGQQQRAAILRAIVNRPPLLLCDEPTGSLNSAQTDIVMKLLDILNKNGQTIILVTHDIKVAVRGRRIIYIEDGRIGGELKFSQADQTEVCRQREKALITFLQAKGW